MNDNQPKREPVLEDTLHDLDQIEKLTRSVSSKIDQLHNILDHNIHASVDVKVAKLSEDNPSRNLRFEMHQLGQKSIELLESCLKGLEEFKRKMVLESLESKARR